MIRHRLSRSAALGLALAALAAPAAIAQQDLRSADAQDAARAPRVGRSRTCGRPTPATPPKAAARSTPPR